MQKESSLDDNFKQIINPDDVITWIDLPLDGQRCQTFVVNVDRNDQVPPLVEPLFQWMGASVDVIPVMNFDDLKRGLQNR